MGGFGVMTTASMWDLRLVGGWQLLRAGRPVKVALRQQRLLAALALYGRQPRSSLAGLLWPDSTDAQAAGSLRESIFLVNRQVPTLLEQTADSVGLKEDVGVDVRQIKVLATRLEENPGLSLQRTLLQEMQDAHLLPGWYEDWVVSEQERWQRLRLSVLERLAKLLLAKGHTDAAMEAACAAIAIEPLRESAHRLLMQCHLAEGNNAKALHAYQSLSLRLRQEYGASPSPIVLDVIGPLLMGGQDAVPELPEAGRR